MQWLLGTLLEASALGDDLGARCQNNFPIRNWLKRYDRQGFLRGSFGPFLWTCAGLAGHSIGQLAFHPLAGLVECLVLLLPQVDGLSAHSRLVYYWFGLSSRMRWFLGFASMRGLSLHTAARVFSVRTGTFHCCSQLIAHLYWLFNYLLLLWVVWLSRFGPRLLPQIRAFSGLITLLKCPSDRLHISDKDKWFQTPLNSVELFRQSTELLRFELWYSIRLQDFIPYLRVFIENV